ncbi:MAG: hypothetical protein SGILL_010627 [Bacillariaceae sp.]
MKELKKERDKGSLSSKQRQQLNKRLKKKLAELDKRNVDQIGTHEYWSTYHPECTVFEAILLEWKCQSGETSNYQDLLAHTDGNKAHKVESMVPMGRTEEEDYSKEAGEVVESWQPTPAVLALVPLQCALSLRPGKDIVHIQLADTLHVPDKSRSTSNYTIVWGSYRDKQ